jgi:hypothetical protein
MGFSRRTLPAPAFETLALVHFLATPGLAADRVLRPGWGLGDIAFGKTWWHDGGEFETGHMAGGVNLRGEADR